MQKRNPATGKPYTNADVARETGVSASLIAQIRQGVKTNPTMNTVEALAELFGVTTDYFSKRMTEEHQQRVVAALELLDAAEDAEVDALFARAIGLSSESLRTVTAVIESMRKAEGLDEPGSK
ncbi:helix-turn-helix domain-containing protein [Streptomyces sp. NPDC001443]